MPSAGDHVVDLTMDSSDDGLTADEVVVAATLPVTTKHRNGEPINTRRVFAQPLKSQSRNSARATSPPSLASRKQTPNGSPARRPTRATDVTPSLTMRFSVRDEIRDSQSPPPSIKSTTHPSHPTPQPSTRASRVRQAPQTQTPTRMDWTVDKIERALADLAQGVSQDHARLVDFVLEEAEKRAPQPRHLSTVDAFADMKSTSIDSISDPPAGVDTMAVKFKASRTLFPCAPGENTNYLAATQRGLRQVERERPSRPVSCSLSQTRQGTRPWVPIPPCRNPQKHTRSELHAQLCAPSPRCRPELGRGTKVQRLARGS